MESRVKKYKALFRDKDGNNSNYTNFVYAKDHDEAMERANNLMNELKDDSLVKAIVVLITNQGSNWAGIYR
jgi:hypothetical protein